ncbi:uncharacterized protein ASCRUDRAFT_81671 [Ascoidea rubescens DSM 1968]|uniref:Chromatin remodelling complex ATPase chain ISW1 n=1 Tax=Ascoidea rubescens DSM 1968 TaxID=1344418 RepID=A0A1D2VDN9_9ASCO|nr:hypothetical protein ASCRUDRAFT_81671 [Ascoidea rubescens DSM 1968]ODV59761.1 hypothetical protein ASCRUDRAFT_81671 [Ascoidea rubescens DSM 1968]
MTISSVNTDHAGAQLLNQNNDSFVKMIDLPSTQDFVEINQSDSEISTQEPKKIYDNSNSNNTTNNNITSPINTIIATTNGKNNEKVTENSFSKQTSPKESEDSSTSRNQSRSHSPTNSEYSSSDYNLANYAGYDIDSKPNQDKKKKYLLSCIYKRYTYLLSLTDLFKLFFNSKAEKDENFKKLLNTVNLKIQNGKRRRKTEKEEDAELLSDEKNENTSNIFEFTQSPGYINGLLRSYQVQGLNWLINLYEYNLSGILADEMGLGKTLQTIALLGYLRYIKCIEGPHLIIVPKSTLDNWFREFKQWTPQVNVLLLNGDKQTRADIVKSRLLPCDFDVVVSSYELVLREKAALKKFNWEYVIIDEAHRIKNEKSLLSQVIRLFTSKNRLLITGTPLQNNLHELWALLNFILPDVFSDSNTFDEWFQNSSNNVQQLHKVLQPFLLRRIKADVETSLLPKKELNLYLKMSDMQKTWYKKILEKDFDIVSGAKGNKTRLLNVVMQLRKCCNHPYLFEGAEPGPPFTTDEHLVYNSHKLKVLDKLLKKLKEDGSRVLIFSQMSRMLDILEDYCYLRKFNYCRIDGQTEHSDRIKAIDDYNAPNSEKFLFLLTTRAGGLGINLTSADIVILYDSDWNPQADLQAMDRAHRIGQKKQVKVFRLVTENAIEEKVLERATQKLRLDQLVIQQARNSGDPSTASTQHNKSTTKDELISMIQHGAQDVFESADKFTPVSDIDIENILKKSEEKTNELNSKYEKLGLDDLQKFTSDSAYEWDGKDFKKVIHQKIKGPLGAFQWINPSKRERKENYSVDMYYRDVLNSNSGRPAKENKIKAPKQYSIYDHQFYPPLLHELLEKEKNFYKKRINYEVALVEGPPTTFEKRKNEQALQQLAIRNAEPLTENEEKLKNELLTQGFDNWSRRDFTTFIHLSGKHGRTNLKSIAADFEGKSYKEILDYSKKFWNNFTCIDNHDKYINQIEVGEEKSEKIKLQEKALIRKVESYHIPLFELKLLSPPKTANKKLFSEDEDRFLILMLYKYGISTEDLYDRIREEIRKSPIFAFDFFLKSRNNNELSRRCQTLLSCLVKEHESEENQRIKIKTKETKIIIN